MRLHFYFTVLAIIISFSTISGQTLVPTSLGRVPPRVVKAVVPPYPSIAKAAGSTGTVTAEVLIDSTGGVIATKILDGPPLLRDAVFQAARAWVFEKAIEPVERPCRLSFTYINEGEIDRGSASVEFEVLEGASEIRMKVVTSHKDEQRHLRARERRAGKEITLSSYRASTREDFQAVKAFLGYVAKNKDEKGKNYFYVSPAFEELDISILGDISIHDYAYAYWPKKRAIIIMQLPLTADGFEWMEFHGYIDLKTQVVPRKHGNLGCCLVTKDWVVSTLNKCLKGEKVLMDVEH